MLGEDDGARRARCAWSGWPAADFARALEWDLDVEGLTSGRGARARPAQRAARRLARDGAAPGATPACRSRTCSSTPRSAGAGDRGDAGPRALGGGTLDVPRHRHRRRRLRRRRPRLADVDLGGGPAGGRRRARWGGRVSGSRGAAGHAGRARAWRRRIHLPAPLPGRRRCGRARGHAPRRRRRPRRRRGATAAPRGVDLAARGRRGRGRSLRGRAARCARGTPASTRSCAPLRGGLPGAVGRRGQRGGRDRRSAAAPARAGRGRRARRRCGCDVPDYPVRNRGPDPPGRPRRRARGAARRTSRAEGTDLAVQRPRRRWPSAAGALALSLTGSADLRALSARSRPSCAAAAPRAWP